MTWLAILFALEAGMIPQNAWYLYEDNQVSNSTGYYTTLEFEAQAWWLFAGGSVRTDMQTDNLTNYDPHWMTYTFNAGVRWNMVEVGWRHMCSHPIQTYVMDHRFYQNPVVEGSFDEVYARVQVQVGGE